MTIKEAFRQFNQIPYKFTLNDGSSYEHTTMQHSNGVWYAYIYLMIGNRRELHSFSTGDTEAIAIENLVIKNSLV